MTEIEIATGAAIAAQGAVLCARKRNELEQEHGVVGSRSHTGMDASEFEKFAKLIILECINCYSPDDSATDWADKMRRMIEP